MPLGAPLNPPPQGWKDPNGDPATIFNNLVNYGWEYMYHCHILGHEEMDMMHAVSFAVAPDPPINPSAQPGNNKYTVIWTDNSTDETHFTIQRNTSTSAWVTIATVPSTTGPETGSSISYVDTTVASNTIYNYRILANNVVGDTETPNFPTVTTNSTPATAPPVASPTNLAATMVSGPSISLTWTDVSNNEDNFSVWRSVDGGAFTQIATVTRTTPQSGQTGGTVTFINTNAIALLVPGETYTYRVTAVSNTLGSSWPSNTAMVLFAAPAAPSGLTESIAQINGGNDVVILNWVDNSNNEAGFTIERATNPGFTGATTIPVGADVQTFTENVKRGGLPTYYYRIQSYNAVGNLGWQNFVPLPAV